MSISKTVVKLAVAALVVAGVVGLTGTAWAEPPSGPVVAYDVMQVKLSNEASGTIECVPKNPTNSQVVGFNALAFKELDAGNLGRIRVSASATRWDISMKTKNGGKLGASQKGDPILKLNISTGKLDTLGYEETDATEFILYTTTDQGKTLKNEVGEENLGYISGESDGENDIVQLVVSIGILDSVGGVVGFIPNGLIDGKKISPTKISADDIKESGGYNKAKLNSDKYAGKGVSFATYLGGDTQYDGGIGRDYKVGGRTVRQAKDQGFGATTGPVYFYVNVGIPDALAPYIAPPTETGDYTETFQFELVASF